MLRTSTIASHLRGARTFSGYSALLALTLPLVAQAKDLDFSLKLEPGVAIPLSEPQSRVYDVGGSQSVKALFGLTRYLDMGPAASFLLLPAAQQDAESGVAWGFGGGLRLKRPHDAKSFRGISPWLDADLLYVRTGDLNRPGFDMAIGASAPLDRSRRFWLGPFVRYFGVLEGSRANFDDRDAKILTLGISLEVGSGIRREEQAPYQAPPAVAQAIVREVRCPDRDADAVPDSVDRCPDVAGTSDSYGCPAYKKVVVREDKLELKEKIQFAWNAPTIEGESQAALDEVAQVLLDNKGFRVAIEGHSSAEGADEHNQTLSEQRANAVRDYLLAKGVPQDRLMSKGFSSSVPIDSNATTAGREANRRVEFVVHFHIVDKESAK